MSAADRADLIARARKALEDARKKLTGNPGAENEYAAARIRLEQLGELRPLRKKYR